MDTHLFPGPIKNATNKNINKLKQQMAKSSAPACRPPGSAKCKDCPFCNLRRFC